MTERPAARREVGAFRASLFIMFTLLNLILLAREELGPVLVNGLEEAGGIEVTRFQVPVQVKPGELRRITCQFRLHKASLHAMKLFKDDQEFFRFTPPHQKMTFPVAGVQVDMNRSRDSEVWLKINKHSGGQYRCQVLIEGTFNSVSAARKMEVVPAGDSGAASGGAGGAWQQRPQQEPSTRPALGRQPHSAVQQHPSHLYGFGGVGSGARPARCAPAFPLVWLLAGLAAALAASRSTIRLGPISRTDLEGVK